MNRTRATVLMIAVIAVSILAAYGFIALVGSETIRQALRWMFAPALFLMGFAVSMLWKIPELAEIKGVSSDKAPRVAKDIKAVQVRLWVMVVLAMVPVFVGPVLSSVSADAFSNALTLGVFLSLTAAIASLLYAAIYLPWLYMDYSAFRIKAADNARKSERRDALLKELDEASKHSSVEQN